MPSSMLDGAITAIVVDQPGSGYSFAPNVVIRDGTIFDPILRWDRRHGHGHADGPDRRPGYLRRRLHDSTPTVVRSPTRSGTGTGAIGHGRHRLRRGHRDHLTSPAAPATSPRAASRSSRTGCRCCATPRPRTVPRTTASEQPGPVPPARGARHHDLPGRRNDALPRTTT